MKNVLRCVAFAVITAITISYALKVLSLKDTSGANEDRYSVYEELYNTDRNMIDVVFLGTSHCYNSVYPALIWQEFGIASFDMAISAQSKNSTVHALKEVLKTQSPKVVFVEMFGLTDDDPEEEGNFYRNNVTMRLSKNMIELVKEEKPEDFYDCLTKWPIVHTRYRELSRDDFNSKGLNSFGRGGDMRMGEPGGFINYEKSHSKEIVPLSDSNKEWIDRLYEVSQEEGFELVFFLSPYSLFDNGKQISNGAREYAESLGITYIDMTEKSILDAMSYDPAVDLMNDYHHNTMHGALKVSRYLAGFISENYDVEDKRGNKEYAQWDKDYQQLKHVYTYYAIEDIKDDDAYLYAVSQLTDYTVVLSLDGDFENAAHFMDYFGVSEEDRADGGKWIYKNSKAEKIMSNTPGESHFVSLGKFDGVKLQCMDDVNMNIFYDLYPYVMTEDGLNVLVYDNFREKLISARAFY